MASFTGAFHILTGIPKRLSEAIEPQQSRSYPAIRFIIALLSLCPQKVCWLQGGREREDCQSLHQQVPARHAGQGVVRQGWSHLTSHRVHVHMRLQYTCRAGIGELPTSAEVLSNSR